MSAADVTRNLEYGTDWLRSAMSMLSYDNDDDLPRCFNIGLSCAVAMASLGDWVAV